LSCASFLWNSSRPDTPLICLADPAAAALHALLDGLQHVPGVKAAKEATVLGRTLQPSASTKAMCLMAHLSFASGALRQAVAMEADDKTIDGCRRELKSVCPELEHVQQDHLRDIINVAAAQFNTGFRGDVGVLKHFLEEVLQLQGEGPLLVQLPGQGAAVCGGGRESDRD
jgi:hypothetical protein